MILTSSAGNDAGNFGINWKVGSLRLLRKLVWTSAHTLNLTITATDGFTVVNMMVMLISDIQMMIKLTIINSKTVIMLMMIFS